MKLRNCLLVLPFLALGATIPAHAQPSSPAASESGAKDKDDRRAEEPKNEDGTMKRAGEIATQPVRDVGLSKKKIPPILVSASNAPYARASGKKCAGISSEIAQLNDALGPDFGQSGGKKGSKVGSIAGAGGEAIVNTFIPFRGLVREVSGAASADRRLQAAVNAGLARRGYLRGVGQARGCRI